MSDPKNALPYTDTKPVGAADFYFAIDKTFAHVLGQYGEEGLRRYWGEMGREYMRPVWQGWKDGGLPAVAAYWQAFFAAEPGADVAVTEEADRVVLDVHACPAISHLRGSGRRFLPVFCQHCYFVSDAAAAQAGLAARVTGGGGSCRQEFLPRQAAAPQDLGAVWTAESEGAE